MKVTDKHIFFWGEWPSNWFKCRFTVKADDGKEYTFYNTEQYFMWIKAITFGDTNIAEQIIKSGANPRKAKALGRKVSNYDDNVWNEKRYQVMVDANLYKYSQNEDLKKLILSKEFEGKGFCESSPVDCVWGIGIHENDASDDESTWKGQNLLGKALDEVRERLSK